MSRSRLNKSVTIIAVSAVFLVICGIFIESYQSVISWKTYVLSKALADSQRLAYLTMSRFFERYGDAQAFALNEKISSYLSDPNPQSSKEADAILGDYARLYRIYPLLVVTDTTGRVVLVNDGARKDSQIRAESFIGHDLHNDSCFRGAQKYLMPRPAGVQLWGTHVNTPGPHPLLRGTPWAGKNIQTFSTPIRARRGQFLGVLCLFASEDYYALEIKKLLRWMTLPGWREPIAELYAQNSRFFSTQSVHEDLSDWYSFETKLAGEKFPVDVDWTVRLRMRPEDLFSDVNALASIFWRIALLILFLVLSLAGAAVFFMRRQSQKRILFEKELTAKIIEAQEIEREDISQEIHDELGQNMTLLNLEFSRIRSELPANNSRVSKWVKDFSFIMEDSTRLVRQLTAELSPAMLKNVGLLKSLQWLVFNFEERSGILCQCILPPTLPELEFKTELNLYRIVQESLTNILRHSQATEVRVNVFWDFRHLVLELNDNGQGFQADDKLRHSSTLGLQGMKRRAQNIGASFGITSFSKKGTRIKIDLPLGKGAHSESHLSRR